ncbi:MAG: LysR family transcriptional regulator [Pseudomonadota bacterium]
MSNWDDYRFVLAVAETGSLTSAARQLKVSQPTVGRRITEIEQRLEARLFERVPDGYRLTDAGTRIASQVRLMGLQAERIEMTARAPETRSDRVCLTASEGIAHAIVTPLLSQFRIENPEVEVDLLISNRSADLLRREADIAIRIGAPGNDTLIGRRLGQAHFGLFGHDSYLARRGMPLMPDDLNAHTIIESTGDIAGLPQVVWLRENAPKAEIAYSSNSILNQMQALSMGVGLMTLPTYLAEDMSRVRRVLGDHYNRDVDIWILTEKRLKDEPVIRSVLDFMGNEIQSALKRLPV